MKLFRKRQCSGVLLVVGILLVVLGLSVILMFRNAGIPEDYDINAFDAIFIVPILVKLAYYEGKRALFQVLTMIGWMQLIVGGISVLFGIPALPDMIRSMTAPFSKGSNPTEQELHDMLESGEMTKSEYDEIRSYLDGKRK